MAYQNTKGPTIWRDKNCKYCHGTGWILYWKYVPELKGEYEFGQKCICNTLGLFRKENEDE